MIERRPGLRLAAGLIAGIVLLIEVQALVYSLRAQSVLQERALRQARQGLLAVRSELDRVLRPGNSSDWSDAARVIFAASLASEVDFYQPDGVSLLSLPRASPIPHWPGPELAAVLQPHGPILTFGPFVRPAPRILTYAGFLHGGKPIVLRLSAVASDLVDDLKERRPLLLGHGLALGLLVLLGALVLLPSWDTRAAAATPALDAYEEAMGRLRDQGEARSRAHEAERRRMAELIQDREAMARAGELTAGIVHEIRNGLGTISGYARLAERSAPGSPAAEAARGVLDECGTLEVVVRRFMDFVRDETLNLGAFDLRRLLSRVAARESRGRQGGAVILGEGGALSVVGDEEMLERALENLIRNAREASGERGRVFVEATTAGSDRVVVSVEDEGPGLAPGRMAELRPFFTTKPGGLGLGLAMALKIVRLHQGELRFEDRSPGGLRVLVELPIAGPER